MAKSWDIRGTTSGPKGLECGEQKGVMVLNGRNRKWVDNRLCGLVHHSKEFVFLFYKFHGKALSDF